MTTPSGPAWANMFPGSTSLDDLVEPFRTNAKRFVHAMRSAGIEVQVSATYRPPERAYLMHWCTQVADGSVAPGAVPPMRGVDIDWTHGRDVAAARAAARAMADAYGIEYPAALHSRHTERLAVDMSISWSGHPDVAKPDGSLGTILSPPQNGGNADLQHIGALYGVFKLQSDRPHWSSDGH